MRWIRLEAGFWRDETPDVSGTSPVMRIARRTLALIGLRTPGACCKYPEKSDCSLYCIKALSKVPSKVSPRTMLGRLVARCDNPTVQFLHKSGISALCLDKRGITRARSFQLSR